MLGGRLQTGSVHRQPQTEEPLAGANAGKNRRHLSSGLCPAAAAAPAAGVDLPPSRSKPWGTAHAVLCCAHHVQSRFAVINADDFYGRGSFQVLGTYMSNIEDRQAALDIGMVGFPLENTLTEHGFVARGVCTLDQDGYLLQVRERTRIERRADRVGHVDSLGRWTPIPAGSLASLNMWASPAVLPAPRSGLPQFLDRGRAGARRTRVLPTRFRESAHSGEHGEGESTANPGSLVWRNVS